MFAPVAVQTQKGDTFFADDLSFAANVQFNSSLWRSCFFPRHVWDVLTGQDHENECSPEGELGWPQNDSILELH